MTSPATGDATRQISIREPNSGLTATVALLSAQAPANAAFLWAALAEPKAVAAIHAMWTGPEISCPLPASALDEALRTRALPLENATITPAPGDVVLTWLPPYLWGPNAMFDVGLYYGPGARCLFPIGWQAGSVVARVAPADLAELAAACGRIRQSGACVVTFARA